MRFKISLTTRLSLIFSAVMLTVWWLSSFILISTLNGYFDNQDRDFLTGKLQLTEEFLKEVAIKWSAAPDMTPQTVLYRRPVAQFSNFQPKIVSSWLILALFQANFLISGRSRLCPYQLVNSNQVRQGE
ncbi:TPA: hypothetical protein ACQVLA_005455 [Serratia marcescens]